MGIKFTPKFKINDLYKTINDTVNRIETDLQDRFRIVGDEFVGLARSQPKPPGFGDETGNLRSSIGYIIFKDGAPLEDNFDGSTEEGKQKGYDIAMEADVLPKGICLVVVAGMGYAAAVESKGYDVISGSSLEAEKLLRESLKRLKNKL